jgi:hypothetical protein
MIQVANHRRRNVEYSCKFFGRELPALQEFRIFGADAYLFPLGATVQDYGFSGSV